MEKGTNQHGYLSSGEVPMSTISASDDLQNRSNSFSLPSKENEFLEQKSATGGISKAPSCEPQIVIGTDTTGNTATINAYDNLLPPSSDVISSAVKEQESKCCGNSKCHLNLLELLLKTLSHNVVFRLNM